MFSARSAAAALAVVSCLGCNQQEFKYEPKQAPSGVQANLPPMPNVPQKPIKNGDSYTIWGASYYLRSRVHSEEVAGKSIKVTGYITKTNLSEAPECAVHETGKEDPEDCNPPVPAFWIADSKDAEEKDSIKVLGWASNFAQLYDAIKEYEKYDKQKKTGEDREPLTDGFWGVPIPDPLPAKGAKVTIQGQYGTTFTRATSGAEADPIMGVLTYEKLEVDEEAPEKASLPGMK